MKTDYLSQIQAKYSFSDSQMLLLKHGIDIIINDSINMLCLLLISLVTGDLFQGVIYLLTFTSLRRHSGGWHASTRLLCYISYQIVFVIMLICSKYTLDIRIIIFLFFISIGYIFINAPVQHIYNPLSDQEVSKNRSKLSRNMIIVSAAFMAFSLNKSHYAFTICYASVWNALCMSLLKHSKMWRKT